MSVAAHAFTEDRCPECKGRCYFLSDNGPAPQEYDCPECDGSGIYVWDGLVPHNVFQTAKP